MSFSTIILAAGQSTRMKSELPKTLHKLASVPIIDWILTTVKNLNVHENIMVVSPQMQLLQDYVKERYTDIKFAIQKHKLGTADAVKSGLERLENSSQNILVLYGDVPFISEDTIKSMENKLTQSDQSVVVVLGFEAKDPKHYGRLLVDHNDKLNKIIEYLDCTESERKITLCNSGVMMVKGEYINELISQVKENTIKKEFYFTDVVEIALSKNLGCQYVVTKEEEVTAVNNRHDLAKAERVIQNILRNKFLSNGVTLIDSDTIYFSADTIIDSDVTIFPNVFIGPKVKIGAGTEVKSFSHLEGVTIEKNSVIGPFARIRPNTNLGENTKVGNFVEIKNSRISANSKISHLSYIGDTKMGKNVNIGAGVITCNYDGFNKHETLIEDSSFIGSNSSLIAPVKIGKGALVAANSAITKEVAANELAIERSEQKNIESGAIDFANKHKK